MSTRQWVALPFLVLWVGGCVLGESDRRKDPLVGDFTLTDVNTGEIEYQARRLFKAKPGSDALAVAAEAILRATFGGYPGRNATLPDILAYVPKDGHRAPKLILMQNEEAVRVLDREPAVWVVLMIEVGKDDPCPVVDLRLEIFGETRPDVTLSPDSLFGAIIQRKGQEPSTNEAKPVSRKTRAIGPLSGDRQLCHHIERFALLPDSVNRLSITIPGTPAATADLLQVGPRPSAVPTPRQRTLFHFSNARRPLYGGSVGFGGSVRNIKSGDWCIANGRCTPSLYVFALLTLWQSPHPATLYPVTDWSAALALGVRILDPALGEATAGLRFGIGQGWSRGLARFGIIAGLTYPFRTSDHTTDKVTTTVTQPDGSTRSTTADTSPEGNELHLFAALDFAF